MGLTSSKACRSSHLLIFHETGIGNRLNLDGNFLGVPSCLQFNDRSFNTILQINESPAIDLVMRWRIVWPRGPDLGSDAPRGLCSLQTHADGVFYDRRKRDIFRVVASI